MKTEIQLENYIEVSKRFKKGARSGISRAVFLIANKLETKAKENIKQSVYSSSKPPAPFKRTGKAQQSITVAKLDDLRSKVYMGVKYGQYLEHGTGIYRGRKPYWTTFGGQIPRPILYKGMRARPFWKPAIDETKKLVNDIINKELRKL